MKKLSLGLGLTSAFLLGYASNDTHLAIAKLSKTSADIEKYKDKTTGCEYLIVTNDMANVEQYAIVPRFKEDISGNLRIRGCKNK